MALDIVIKMNGSKQNVVLALLLLVLTVGYTSGSVLSSSSMLAQQGQENVTQDNVAHEQVQQECDEEGAALTDNCNNCFCLNGHLSCSNKICFINSESEGPLVTDNETPQNSTKAYEDPDNQVYEVPDYTEDPYYKEDPVYQEDLDYQECVEGTRWTEECNICECSFGQPLCTMKTCQCVHGSNWVEECNTCDCYDGEATCTNKKCLSDSVTTCKEGSSWTQDCNTCFCSNDITSCSKEICPSEGDVTSTQLPEMTNTKKCNGTFAGCSVMGGPPMNQLVKKIKIPSELNFCIYSINGQQKYFAYIETCYKEGKHSCAYCEKGHKYNPGTCKCHKKSRFRGRKFGG